MGRLLSMSSRSVVLLVLLACVPRMAVAAPSATLFRIFLTDGSDLTSFGEYARVGDDVIFSMPAGGSADDPRLQLVTLPAKSVDWTRTDRYNEEARAEHYAGTRGEDDFAQLSNEVARVLNDLAVSPDHEKALALAQQAHDVLVKWPLEHYHYREAEVRDILSIVDNAIAGLSGKPANGFQLAFVASAADLVHEPIAGMPGARAQIDQLLRAAGLTPRAADRMDLLQSALNLVKEAAPTLPSTDVDTLRTEIEQKIHHEVDVDQKYARMSQRLLADGRRGAQSARASAVERVLTRLNTEDERLGRQRPETVRTVRAELQAQLNDARRLRLLRDQWVLRQRAYQQYQESVGVELLQLVKSRPLLEAIRTLEGPSPNRLITLRSRLSGGAERLQRQRVPPEMQAAHDLLVGAWRFAENAATSRYDAVSSGNVSTAWKASSAAAGALMLLDRAQAEIRTVLEFPRLK